MILSPAGVLIADTTPTSDATGTGGPDWLMIGMIVILVILVFFMWRNSRKRKADQEKLGQTMVPGVEVMTNFGLFGKIVSFDTTANTAELEIAPGTVIKVHRQTLVRVVEPGTPGAAGEPRSVEEAMEIAEREQRERETSSEEPKFGERLPEAGAGTDKADGDSKL